MNFQSYLNYFNNILELETKSAPYDEPDYLHFTEMNLARMNRWIKKGSLGNDLIEEVKKIDKHQTWIVITEPWCGDAAHIVPFIHLVAELNPKITAEFELRDSEPHRIDDYLTNGSKAIPILIIKDENGQDLKVWGPRPSEAQKLHAELKAKGADFDETINTLQAWYNKDKGKALSSELAVVLSELS